MALEPGRLTDLGGPSSPGGLEWSEAVATAHTTNITASGTPCLLATADVDITDTVVHVDWDAFPVQVSTCLRSDEKANLLLDWTTAAGDQGRLVGHDEYLEWRTVRRAGGRITRIELTTELQDYWRVLARHRPERVLQLAARFAGEPAVDPRDVYGPLDPFAPGVTPDRLGDAFDSLMLPRRTAQGRVLPPRSPYNNGQKAICFMYKGINTLNAAVQLAAFAAHPFAHLVNGSEQPLTGRELINSTQQAAADCRNSDPTIVETVAEAAFRRRKIVFDDPFGVYISNVRRSRILLPDGSTPIPEPWFTLERGTAGTDKDTDPDRFQRLVLQVPPNPEGIEVADLISADTGEPIRTGAELVRLVTVNFLVRVSEADKVTADRLHVDVTPPGNCADDPACAAVNRALAEFEQTLAAPGPPSAAPVSRLGRPR